MDIKPSYTLNVFLPEMDYKHTCGFYETYPHGLYVKIKLEFVTFVRIY